MSEIDRAFIDAYGDENEPAAPARRAARTRAKEPSSATTTSVARRAPKRAASQAKRGAAAAAIKGNPPVSVEAPPAPIAPFVAVAGPSVAASAYSVESITAIAPSMQDLPRPTPHAEPIAGTVDSKPKVVVGRRALQQLAESAVQTSTRLSAPVPNQRAAVPSASEKRPAMPMGRSSASMPSETRHERSAATAMRSIGSNRPTVDAPLPLIAALEVDGFVWPDVCDRLVENSKGELESIVRLLDDGIEKGTQVVSVSSTSEGDGATTMALCLARLVARNRRVCLVDANFCRPSLAESLGLEPQRGLGHLLGGDATLADVLIDSLEDTITVLPLAAPLAADVVERSTLRLTLALGELRERFDLVLIDAGSMERRGREVSILRGGAGIDAALIVRSEETDPEARKQVEKSIEQWSMPCLGVIENRWSAQPGEGMSD
jgi:Mrp family chromosome partitioning ATPase